MESRFGLEYIVDNGDYTTKLAKALDCDSITVKKQVFELLSALCVYSSEGYTRALQALEQYKEFKCERYRLKLIVDELRLKENSLDYKTTLLAFVNCVIISTPQLKDRVRIRNEFIGLKLLAVLDDIRRYVSNNSCSNYADLGVQLDVFQEQKENDEAQILDSPYGVDLNSHVDVFYAILRQVAETPQEIPFLNILQHLLRIEPKEAISDIIWDTAEKLVHRATLVESRQDATRVLRSPSVQSRLCCHNHRSVTDTVCGSRKQSLNIPNTPNTILSSTSPPAPPAPPDDVSSLAAPPPPPPPPPPQPSSLESSSDSDCKMGAPPIPPPLIAQPEKARHSPELMEIADLRLPQQETPTPKTKMKTINWNKIPNNKVVGKHNIWSVVARSHQHSPMADLDWSEMEGLFCQTVLPSTASSVQSSPKLRRGDTSESYERRKKELSEIILLDGKRSLNVNIFLKQFRCSNEDIIRIIREGAHDDIGAEKLRGLLKMLPEIDELEMLRAFDGDKRKLANAEKFLLQLIEVPYYKLRIESMLLKEEFPSSMSYLEPSINSMIVAGEDLMTNKPLQEVLYMVICAGNFLNSGGYAGNAAGVKLTSLQKLTDIRANKPGMNLIHYVAMQIEKKRKDLLKFADDMSALDDASKTTVEQLQNEVQTLDNRTQKIRKQVELPSTELEIKSQMRDFLKIAEQEINCLKDDLKELESVRQSLADFFCEDPNTFKIEECFKIFHGFCVKFKQAVNENERRRMQEEQASARRRQREELFAAKKRSLAHVGIISPTSGDSPIMDILLNDMQPGVLQKRHYERDTRNKKTCVNGSSIFSEEESQSATNSPIVSRRRIGSFSGDPPNLASTKEDTCSPDITPTGSLCRRRSRVPSEEDEGALMDFLRGGEQSSIRERKSWGSLDRSWARRARGGKRRPDLLNADFSNDRERPASPSPVLENKPLLPTPEEEAKPKAWRQKIEAWLQENEKEEKQNASMLHKAQRRHYSSRRSLENDSENEGKDSILSEGGGKSRKESLSKLPEQESIYKRVYSDWKPTIDKTDVVGTMEAIADIQPQNQINDKSAWRESQLNSSNSEDAEIDTRKLHLLKARGGIDSSPPLEAIKEEERKKALNSFNDTTTSLYCERLSQISLPLRKTVTTISVCDEPSLPPVPRKTNRNEYDIVDKIEIDSDNIETPPATRRLFGSVRNVGGSGSKDEEEVLGDGQFDRFSSARRTRRYRKYQDDEQGNEVVEKQIPRPTTLNVKPRLDFELFDKKESSSEKPAPGSCDTQVELAKKEPAVRNKIPVLQSNYIRNGRISASLPYSFKGISLLGSSQGISDKNEVNSRLNALRNRNRDTTFTPSFIPEIKIKAITPTAKSKLESQSHDMHDEGFEETQSLISDSPSQTTSSGYNYEIDTIDSLSLSALNSSSDSKQVLFGRTDSSGSGDAPSYNSLKLDSKPTQPSAKKAEGRVSMLPKRTNSLKNERQPNMPTSVNEGGMKANVNRSSSMQKTSPPSRVASNISSNSATRYADRTLKRSKMVDSSAPASSPLNTKIEPRNQIQRFPSKSSLKSSRSSLNSCASISTVKALKNDPKLESYNKVIKSLTSLQKAAKVSGAQVKKSLTTTQLRGKTNNSYAASRSSSSASSTEPLSRRNGSLMMSTSFKENSAELASDHLNKMNSQSFMRPTASSSAKDMTDPKPKFMVRTPFKY